MWRRFSDFLGLYEKLAGRHLAQGRLVPPPPEKSLLGNARAKLGKAEEENSVEFLERRRMQLQRYLQHTAAHPLLLVG